MSRLGLGVELGERGPADELLEPPEEAPGRRHATVGQPEPRRRVGIEVPAPVDDRGVGDDEDVPGAAQLPQPVPRLAETGGVGGQDMVSASDIDRYSYP